MGSKGLSSPIRLAEERQSVTPAAQSQPGSGNMSLAAFMGGRATGPRLNRHEPQQNAHDPTQFEQRTRVDAPHPVFGRGGVAMPGMTSKGRTSLPPGSTIPNREGYDRSRSAGPTPNQSVPVDTTLRTEIENRPVTSRNPTNGHGSRERGTSVSTATSRARSPHLQSKKTPSSAVSDPDERSDLLEPFTDKRNITNRSPSPLYARGKTPDPSPSTHNPQSTSRDYDLLSSSYPGPTREQSKFPPPPPTKKPDSISLAAFMGGRATGPRLNKHAPQQDAQDPTQFDQRTNITDPHPVFGMGGIAMPGMTAKETASTKFRSSEQLRGGVMDRSMSTEEQPSTFPSTGNGSGSRERAISSPSWGSSYSPSPGDYNKADYGRRPVTQSSIPDLRTKTPTNAVNTPSSSPPVSSHPHTPRPSGPSTSPVPSSPRKASQVTTPSLARPIHPVPRQSPTGPQIPTTQNPSRAFLRPQAEKEPTPSLSRLKGRGFVQNMIKTSSQLEASANEFGGAPRAGPRKSSVLDRWQPAASTSAGPASPPMSPKPTPIRKSATMDQSSSSPNTTSGSISPGKLPHKPVDTSRSLKTAASLPTIPPDPPRLSSLASSSKQNDTHTDMPQDVPGLGSSSTLISYIKPTKTGDEPLPPAAAPFNGRMSLGRVEQGGKKSSTSELPVASSQPLKHVRFSSNK
jgi:hypothetical protein